MVDAAVRERVSEKRPEGLFLRLGEKPMDRDELKGLFPRLPEDLTWRPMPPGEWKYDPRLPPDREEDPAGVIPAIQ